jgi:hypothetical protein
MTPPLHFSIPGEEYDTLVRVEFKHKLDDFNFHINDVSRNFTSVRQAYNYLSMIYGRDNGMAMLGLISKHVYQNQ